MAQVPPDISEGLQLDSAEADNIQVEADQPATSAAIVPTPSEWATTAYAVHADFGGDVGAGRIPCSGLAWEEQAGELATRITFQFPDMPLEGGQRLSNLVQLGTPLTVLAAMGSQPFQEVARGIVEEITPNDGTGGTFEVVAYDPIKATLDSKIDAWYEWGNTPKTIITDILDTWHVPYDEFHPMMDVPLNGPYVAHAKTIAEVMSDCLNQAMQLQDTENNDRLVIRSTLGKISINQPGNNDTVYWLREDANQDVSSVREHISITDMVTTIRVTGKPIANDQPGVVGILDSSQANYGITRQDIITLSQHTTIEEVEKQARMQLNQRGSPRHDRSLEAPDVPMLRKYDMVRVTAGTMDDHFYVESVSHDEGGRKMSLSLSTLRTDTTVGDSGVWHDVNADAIPEDTTTGSSSGGREVLVSGGHVTDAQLYALARNAGFSGQDAIIAVAISLAEDGSSDPQARNVNTDATHSVDLGLWQINSQHWGKPGIGSEGDLVDPQKNANAAHTIWQDAVNRGANGWQPWSTYPTAYRKFMERATAASMAPAVSAPSSQAAVTGAKSSSNSALINAMNGWANVPYQFGGTTKAGVDCSGFTQAVFTSVGVRLPRTAAEQWAATTHVSTPQFGDLCFFKGTYGPPDMISHVGIYVGNGEMANAVEPHVKLTNINTQYWKEHLAGFGRVRS